MLAGCSGDDAESTDPVTPQPDPSPEDINVSVVGEVETGRILRVRVYAFGRELTDADVYLNETQEVPQEYGAHGAENLWYLRVPERESITLSVHYEGQQVWEKHYDVTLRCVQYRDHDRWFSLVHGQSPVDEVQYNPHRDGTSPAMDGVFAPYAGFDPQELTFLPYLLAEWRHEPGRMIATLREDVTWETGDPVDADAIAFQWEILLESDHVAADVVTGVEVVGEYEVAFAYPEGTDPRLVEHAVLHERADHPPADWQPVADGDVAPAEHVVDEPTASGPLTLTDADGTSSEWDSYPVRRYEPRSAVEGAAPHPATENHVNWSGYEVLDSRHNVNYMLQSMIAVEVDGCDPSRSWTSEDREQYIEVYREYETPGAGGLALWFDHRTEPWSDRTVRRAIASAIDPAVATDTAHATDVITPSAQTGLPEPTRSEWFDEAVPDGLRASGADRGRARSLLASAGYEPGDLAVTIGYTEHAVVEAVVVEAVAGQLSAFGIDVERRSIAGDASSALPTDGEFDLLALDRGTSRRQFHPYFAYRYQLLGDSGTPARETGYVDAENPVVSLDGTSIPIRERLQALVTAPDNDSASSIVDELARVVNRDVPYVEIYQDVDRAYVQDPDTAYANTAGWDSPTESGPHVRTRHPHFWLPLQDDHRFQSERCGGGLLKAREEE